MIESIGLLKDQDFLAVKYLSTTSLMTNHSGTISLSREKPNIIVGPNGSGKSAFLRTLSLITLTNLTGVTCLNNDYVVFADDLWKDESYWSTASSRYLPGIEVIGVIPFARYYRPNMIPGEESMLTAALMTGYHDEARTYGNLTKEKSSGQAARNLIQHLLSALDGKDERQIKFVKWNFPKSIQQYKKSHRDQSSQLDTRATSLLSYSSHFDLTSTLLIMDEPEQSLDAYEQAMFWRKLSAANCEDVQIVIASHSSHPFLQPEKFNIIEAVPGYVDSVRGLLSV